MAANQVLRREVLAIGHGSDRPGPANFVAWIALAPWADASWLRDGSGPLASVIHPFGFSLVILAKLKLEIGMD